MADRLKDKRIIITGAADNIGKAAVRAFVAEGARVVVGDIDDEARAARLKRISTRARTSSGST